MMQPVLYIILLMGQGLAILLLAPLFIGWIRQVKCWLQNRSAPPLLQPYYEWQKLLCKQPLLAENASWLFRLAPYVYVTCLIVTCFALPFFGALSLASSRIDVIVFAGLLSLGRIFLVLAAMDVGTAFGSLGARREMFVACLAEPVLLVIFLNVALLTHTTHLSAMSAYFIGHPNLYPGVIFALLAFLLVLLAETGRVPVDNPATHLELTMLHEAMILEYSGRYLALIEWGNALKLILYLLLWITLFFPYGLSTEWHLFPILIGGITTVIKLFLLAALIGFIESINAKMRLFRIPEYLAIAFTLAILGILMTQLLEVSV